MWVGHIWILHSSVEGRLGSFHLLTVVNNAAMNIHIQVFFKHLFSVLDGYRLSLGEDGHVLELERCDGYKNIVDVLQATKVYLK